MADLSLYADMAELADALDLGSSGIPCRFDSCHPHSYLYDSKVYYILNIVTGCGSAWLERLIWDQEVAGSNPVTPI